MAASDRAPEREVEPTAQRPRAGASGEEPVAAIGAALAASREMVAAFAALARLEVERAARGLVRALLLSVAAVTLACITVVLLAALLLVGLLHLLGSSMAALAVTALLSGLGTWLLLRSARLSLRPITLPVTRAELSAALEPLRGVPR